VKKNVIKILFVLGITGLSGVGCTSMHAPQKAKPLSSTQIIPTPAWSCTWKGDAENVILEPLSNGTLKVTIKGGQKDHRKGAIISFRTAQWRLGNEAKMTTEITSFDGPIDLAAAVRTDEYYESPRQTIDSRESISVSFDLTANRFMSQHSNWKYTTTVNRKEPVKAVELVLYPVPNKTRTLFIKPVKLTDIHIPTEPGKRAYSNLKIINAKPFEVKVPQFEKFEIQVDITTAYTNPFDPKEIRVDASFVSPSGITNLCPGFLYALSQHPGDPDIWHVRFSPDEPGTWTWQIIARTPTAEESTILETMVCIESADHGSLRISKNHPFYFEYTDGTFFYPIGHNVCWNSPAQYHDQFKKMGENGENWSRIWIAPWNTEIEWTPKDGFYNGLGKYELARAEKLDQIIEEAEKNGLYLQLVLHEHCRLSTTVNSEWANNPYNAKRGGMCAVPKDFLTMEKAKRLAENRIRYLIARYGYSSHVMAWELFNEADFVDAFNLELDAQWHREMAEYIHKTDPHHHMVTTSYISNPNPLTYNLSEIDYTQSHIYAPDVISFFSYIYPFFTEFKKPHFIGEFGRNSKDGVDAEDKTGKVLHSAIWAQFMNPDGGNAMSWWWYDLIDPNNLYDHFKALSQYAEGLDRRTATWSFQTGQFGSNAHVLSLVSENIIHFWMYDTNVLPWSAENRSEYPKLTGTLTLTNIENGTWIREQWDTYTGEMLHAGKLEATENTLALPINAKGPDVAFKLKHKGQATHIPRLVLGPWNPGNRTHTPRYELTIHRTAAPVTIDGNLEEWSTAEQYTALPHDGRSPNDNSLSFSIAHDDTNLYVVARVTDDVILRQKDPGSDFWQDDCVEFWIDALNNTDFFNNMPHNPHCYQINIAPAANGKPTINTAYRNPDWNNKIFPHVEAVSALTSNGYIIEARFPLNVLRGGTTPENPGKIGFNISVCDGDPGKDAGKPIWHHLLWQGEHEWDANEWAAGKLED